MPGVKPAPDDPKIGRVVAAGRALGIDVRPVTFDHDTRTAEDAARAIGCSVAQIVKSLVFAVGGAPVLFLVSGENRLDVALGAAAAGAAGLERVDANAAKAASGFSIGATPPFGLATDMPVFMDEDLLQFDEVWAAAGRPDSVFPLDPRALLRATGATARRLAAR